MKSMLRIIGLVLIVVGIIALSYQGITYTKREKIAEIGDVQVTTENQKTVHFPPILGGLCFVAGLVLVIVGRKS